MVLKLTELADGARASQHHHSLTSVLSCTALSPLWHESRASGIEAIWQNLRRLRLVHADGSCGKAERYGRSLFVGEVGWDLGDAGCVCEGVLLVCSTVRCASARLI